MSIYLLAYHSISQFYTFVRALLALLKGVIIPLISNELTEESSHEQIRNDWNMNVMLPILPIVLWKHGLAARVWLDFYFKQRNRESDST